MCFRFPYSIAQVAFAFVLTVCSAADVGNVRGQITDAQGTPLSGVRVVLQAAPSNNALTDSKGKYVLKSVPTGAQIFLVTVPATGATFRATCQVSSAGDKVCDIVVPNTGLAEQGGVIGAATVRDLPVNGRDIAQAASLEAGVATVRTQQSATDTNSGRGQRGFGQQISLSGARPQQNNYMLDGITINDYANSAPGSVLGLELGADAVDRIAVNTSSYPAQNGRSSGGVVHAVTRSGSDEFHGSVYEFLRNSALDAKNYFDNPKPPFRRNQFGAASSLPIWRGHTYLFANYEGLRQSLGITQIDTVLSPAARQGQLSTGPVSVAPQIVPYLSLFPLPNAGLLPSQDTGIFRFSSQQITGEDYFTSRVDHRISESDKIAASYVFDRARTVQPDSMDFKETGLRTRRQVLSFNETHIKGSATSFNTRFGVNRDIALIGDNPGVINPNAGDTSLGFLPGVTPGKIDVVGVTSFPGGLHSTSLFNFHWTSIQAYEDVASIKGRHHLTAGVSLERTRDNMAALANQNGEYAFQSISNFLQNQPFTLTLELPGSNANRGLRQTVVGAYIQDDVHLGSVDFTAGMRYETATVPTDVHDRLSTLRNMQDPTPHLGDPYFANPTHRNFEPRLGFAWSPPHLKNMVVRSGFGIFDVLPLSYEFELLSLFAAPFVEVGTPSNLPVGSFPYGGVAIAENGPGVLRNMYIQPNPRRNYVMQWNLNIEQKLAKSAGLLLGYVGSRGIHQPFRVDDTNIVLPAALTSAGYIWPSPPGSAPKLNPAVGREDGLMWIGDSYYDALQTQFHATPLSGLEIRASYTWGRSIDTGSATIAGDQFSNSINSLPWFDTRLNRGPSDFNVAQNLSLHGDWQLPSVGQHVARALTRGWHAAGTFQASTGAPFTLLIGGDPLGLRSSDPTDVPDRLHGSGCGSAVVDPRALSYVNTSCFTFPAVPTLRGNLGRNSLTGPGLQTLDLSIHRNIVVNRISDHFNVQLRIDAFNLLNRANFAPPLDHKVLFNANGTLVPGAGLIDSTQTPPRQLQLGMKLSW